MTDQQNNSNLPAKGQSKKPLVGPFRRAILRGLAIIMPPLLTLVLFLWAGNLILNNILRPIESTARQTIVWIRGDIRPAEWAQKQTTTNPQSMIQEDGEGNRIFIEIKNGPNRTRTTHWIEVGRQWIRKEVYDSVNLNPGLELPATAEGYCHRYAQLRYLRPQFTIPLFIALFILILYVLGKFLALGVGRMIWSSIETLITRIPVISNVYSSVKQVTDFALSENEIEFTRVVAVEYPRRGIWSIGFVTGESMKQITKASGEPMVSVLMPTSPMPATGFTISIPKSQTVDMNLTVDQAIQFVVSCGVVVSHPQNNSIIEGERPDDHQPDDQQPGDQQAGGNAASGEGVSLDSNASRGLQFLDGDQTTA